VSVARRKLIAAASAIGLGLSVVAQAAGSPAHGPTKQGPAPEPTKQRAGPRHTDRPSLAVLEGPGKRFDKSIELARRKAERAQLARRTAQRAQARGARASDVSTATTGGIPSPESLGVSTSTLDSIAACESGGDPTAVSADGTYRGKYQFDYGTWASVGGSGDPAAASVAEQDYRAALLYSRGGSSPWPICG
jgi:soluble lytic murein transglycosylase-like protein